MSTALKSIEREMAAAVKKVEWIDQQIIDLKESRKEQVKLVRQLGAAKAAVLGQKRPRVAEPRTGADKAGPAAVEKVRTTAQEAGKVTQAEITRLTGLNSGQVSAAVRELEESGVLRETGVKIGRTREFEYAG